MNFRAGGPVGLGLLDPEPRGGQPVLDELLVLRKYRGQTREGPLRLQRLQWGL